MVSLKFSSRPGRRARPALSAAGEECSTQFLDVVSPTCCGAASAGVGSGTGAAAGLGAGEEDDPRSGSWPGGDPSTSGKRQPSFNRCRRKHPTMKR